MSDSMERRREAVVARVLRGPGEAAGDARRAAFDGAGVAAPAEALIGKVARHAWKVTDADVAAARAGGLSEDEVFELAVAAALGQASRQLSAARAALDAARGPDDAEEAP